jgi:hypothetical protein
MSDRTYTPAALHVLAIGEQRGPWRLAPISRLEVAYHTPCSVRVRKPDGMLKTMPQAEVFALETEADWALAQREYAALQTALDELAADLRTLGAYSRRLEQADREAANPLSPTVIRTSLDPDTPPLPRARWPMFALPRLNRYGLERHTPKMLYYAEGYDLVWQSNAGQANHILCRTDADWARVTARMRRVQRAQGAWWLLLATLSTYQECRYRKAGYGFTEPITVTALNGQRYRIAPADYATEEPRLELGNGLILLGEVTRAQLASLAAVERCEEPPPHWSAWQDSSDQQARWVVWSRDPALGPEGGPVDLRSRIPAIAAQLREALAARRGLEAAAPRVSALRPLGTPRA